MKRILGEFITLYELRLQTMKLFFADLPKFMISFGFCRYRFDFIKFNACAAVKNIGFGRGISGSEGNDRRIGQCLEGFLQ